jgi:galactokinase
MTRAPLADAFHARFNARPRLFQAPGRINIIGEHTDYCGGLVMPAAIDRWCTIATAPTTTRALRLAARDLGRQATLDLDHLTPAGDWTDYIAGVADALQRAGVALPGMDMMIESGIPMGAGVSSSAALEVASTHAMLALAGQSATGAQIALWAQEAENRFAGMPCGIMDQFASANGVRDHAIMLDCRSLEFQPVPLSPAINFLVVNSMVRHTHVSGEYASRRADCEEAARLLDVPALRDVTPERLTQDLHLLPERVARRARHVVSEIARVEQAALAMQAGDFAGLGHLIDLSHDSLATDMQVSIDALDQLAAIARDTPGVYGARMMGGGFGGCVIALAETAAAATALATITARYAEASGVTPDAFICRAVDGAGEIVS